MLWPEVALDVGRSNRLRQALSALRSVLEPRAAPTSPVLLADRRTVRPRARRAELRCRCAASGARARRPRWRGAHLPRRAAAGLLRQLGHRGPARPGGSGRSSPRPADGGFSRGEAAAPRPSAAVAPLGPRLPSYLTHMFGFEAAAAGAAGGRAGASAGGAARAGRRGQDAAGGRGGARARGRRAARRRGARSCRSRPRRLRCAGELHHRERAARCRAARAAPRERRRFRGRDDAGRTAPGARRARAGRAQRAAHLEQLRAARRSRERRNRTLVVLPAGLAAARETSRRALGLDGEVEFALAPLPLPAAEGGLREHARNPAVELFAARARAARADFHLGERNHALVAAICRELEGLPLGDRTGRGARARSLSLPDLLAMLQDAAHGAPGRALTLLSRPGPRSADDARHASMLRVVEWSWLHLSAAQRALLCGLSVFDGGATLQAASAVAGVSAIEAATLLDELVASSVVRVVESASGAARYQPFEPVREYALLQPDAAGVDRLRAAHLRWVGQWRRRCRRRACARHVSRRAPGLTCSQRSRRRCAGATRPLRCASCSTARTRSTT